MSTLAQLWRYPVKSMMGERVVSTSVGERGLDGDRAWAVVDVETGLVASAKSPRKWSELLQMTATTRDGCVRIDLGGRGKITTSDVERASAVLSERLGRTVELTPVAGSSGGSIERDDPLADSLIDGSSLALLPTVRGTLGEGSPPGTFFDFAPVHLISTATLEHLDDAASAAGDGPSEAGGDPRRFRPNIVVDVDGPAFGENEWPGSTLVVGDVEIEILLVSPRCVVPSLPQRGLVRNVETIRAIARQNRVEIAGHGVHSCAGAYGRIITPGVVAENAPIEFRNP